LNAEIKIRYSAKPEKGVITPLEDGKYRVDFETPVRAATPGQSAVFYDGDILLGGGKII
ncbi:MAG: tRNA 2-thiouridine(34) synthase MnmA, partial [Clostridia bacterium]|nr:tRNA 2-thiouridine(34) synthase MnmA [Clostridia bacterium]